MTRFKTTAALVLWTALTVSGSEVSTVSPTQAFEKLKTPGTYLVDVRSIAEYYLVGHPVQAYSIPLTFWNEGLQDLERNENFVRDLQARFRTTDVLVFICRSGGRSRKAAEEAQKAGFAEVYSVDEGFEGRRTRKGCGQSAAGGTGACLDLRYQPGPHLPRRQGQGRFPMSPPEKGEEARLFRTFAVRTYECDPRGRLRLEALLDYFQDSAAEHAEKLGAGVTDLIRRNLTWVLSRYHVRSSAIPAGRNPWSSPLGRVSTRGCSPSANSSSGTGGKPPGGRQQLLDADRPPDQASRSSGERLVHISGTRAGRGVGLRAPAVVGSAEIERSFRVRLSDLDWNKHVNHVVTIAWALETPAPDFLEKHEAAEIEVDFRGQAFFGDSTLCRMELITSGRDPLSLIQIVRENDGRELARLRILWRARPEAGVQR